MPPLLVRRRLVGWFAAVACLLGAAALAGQSLPPPEIRAVRTTLQPVIDGAALLLLGDVPEEPAPVSVSIEVYYDDADRSRSVFTLDFEPAGGTAPDDSIVWRVTATSFVPLDAPT